MNKHALTELAPAYVSSGAAAPLILDPSPAERLSILLHPRIERPNARLIALTFDDGPYPVATPLLLDRLRDLHVPATFFVIGADALQYPELTRRIAAYGNEVDNHTFTHPELDRLNAAQIDDELREASRALQPLTGSTTVGRRMRPPHGRYTEATIVAAQAAGYDVVLWTDDPGDWRPVAADQLEAHVLAHATAPEILLLHSGRMATVAMLDRVVPRFRAAGYRFVTVGGLVEAAGGPVAINDWAHVSL
ncbi:MAG: polysaccharide deacetylase family protein [Candidatus Eremiobacteraeota bacterium]|nr:polysaccharide deacetylase family protein [Candidatus Eremiobacteraeota bacterium]